MSAFEDFFVNLGGELGDAFESFGNIVASGGAELVGTIGNGVIGVYRDAAGGIAYALDATKATANDVGAWTEGAAGSVTSFSLDTYDKAKRGVETVWHTLSTLGMEPMPELGPPDPRARTCMKYLLGGSEAAVAGWESNARSLGYTMAWNVGCSVQMVGSASAFSGIYLDRGGTWGFFTGTETEGPALAMPSAGVEFQLWMVFGGKDRFGGECRQLGLSIDLPFSVGLNVSFGGHLLLTSGFDFLGFHIKAAGGLGSSALPTSGGVGLSVTAPDSLELSSTLAEKAGGYDAVVRAIRNPSSESKVIASASLATLPFVRNPSSPVLIQVKGSRRFYDVAFTQSDPRNEVIQRDLTGYGNQQFLFKDNGDGSYLIDPMLSRVNNAVFDIAGSSGDNGAALIQYGQHGQNNQRFQVMSADNGWYYLLNKNSGKVLSCADRSVADRANVVQRVWDHGQDQMVRFFSTSEFPQVNRSYVLTNVAFNFQASYATGQVRPSQSFGPTETWKVEATTDGSICLKSTRNYYLSTNGSMFLDPTPGWHIVPTGDGLFTVSLNGQEMMSSNGINLFMANQECSVPAMMGGYDWNAARTWSLPETGRGIVSFTADVAVDDVYVLISNYGNTSSAYEIIIGGWSNTRTAIRRGSGGPEVAAVPIGLTNRSGQNPLWVSVDSVTGRIEIGRGAPGSDCILSYKDPNFFSGLRCATFGSYENGIQYSQVTPLQLPANSSVAIPARNGAYDFSVPGNVYSLPEAGRGTVMFTANGNNDVHVAFSTQNSAGDQLYEVVIGGWNNSRSVIRRGSQGTELAAAQIGLKAPGRPNPLWVSIDSTTGWIKVGRGQPGQDVILSYQDAAFITAARYVTFSSWNVPIDYSQIRTLALNATPPTETLGYGLWRLSEVACVADTSGAYDGTLPVWRLPQGRGVFSFTIDSNDAYVLIGPSPTSTRTTSDAYEFIIGGWGNTKTVLYRGGQVLTSVLEKVSTPGGRNDFWISIDDRSGIIQLGRNSPGQDILISVVDPVLRGAAPLGERFVRLSASGRPCFFSNLAVSSLTPNVSTLAPPAPQYGIWMRNYPIIGSLCWVNGTGVRYSVAYELSDGSELRGPWWSVPGSDSSGYMRPGYACPELTNIGTDPSGRAVARRIYRQFQNEAAERRIGRIANNTETTYRDGDTLMAINWSRVGIGDLNVTGVKRTTVPLPSNFGHPPAVVLATPIGEDYTDTVVMSTSVVGGTTAMINSFRVDALSRWGMNLGASVLSCDVIKVDNLQSGSTGCGGSNTPLLQKTITFPQAFAQPPRILATARGENYADTFGVTVLNVTTTGFTVNILRVDTGLSGGWSQNVRVDWVAFRPEGLGELHAYQSDSGLAAIGTGTSAVKRVPVSFNRTFASPPTLILTAHGENYVDVFGVTATQITTTGFIANIKRADAPANGWSQNLLLDWLALV